MDKVWQGATLRKLRMLAGVSLNGVAAACGVSHGSVSQWELGMTTPAQRHLETMAELYGMPLELLLYEIGYELSNPPSLRQWYKARAAVEMEGNTSGERGETSPQAAVPHAASAPAPRRSGRFLPSFAAPQPVLA